MREDSKYISDEDIEQNGGKNMKPTNSRAINEWLAKTNKTLNDQPESLRGLLSKEVEA